MIKLSEEQRKVVESPEKKLVVIASPGSGKAQPDYTIIPTPEGFKRLDSLKVGDYVFNEKGQKIKILGIFPQGEQEIYKITFADGRTTECCKNHLWSYNDGRGGYTTNSLKKMIGLGWKTIRKTGANNYKFKVPNLMKSVEFAEQNYDIPPYVIGAFIGDGCCLEKRLTFSSADEELVQTIADLGNFNYVKLHPNNYSWEFHTLEDSAVYTEYYFEKYVKNIVRRSNKKSIPDEYMIGSTEQRLELLRGLMDTDGSTGDGRHSPSFSTSSFILAKQVYTLAKSLGFHSTLRSYDRQKKGKSIEYDVGIFTSNQRCHEIFKLSRKKEKAFTFIEKQMRRKNEWVSIINIEATGQKTSMRCIQVDNPTSLYLTNDFIITHNTLVLTERVRWALKQGKDPSKMVCITFTNNAAEEMRQRLGEDYKDGMFIGTIHSYANLLLSRYGIDTRSLLDKENFDELFELMMSNPGAIQSIDFLALDEAQDSSLQQFEFIFDLLQPNSFIAVADPRQSIYQFAGGNPKLIINLANQYDVTMYELTNNFRSKDEIIAYSNWVLTKMKKQFGSAATGTRGDNGIVENIYGKEYITIIEYDKNYQDWAILCRTNNRVNSILTELKRRGIPAITFRQAQGSLEDLQDKMKENAVKVLTVHSAKGLEFPKVIVAEQFWKSEEDKRIVYVAATRAKNELYWLKKGG